MIAKRELGNGAGYAIHRRQKKVIRVYLKKKKAVEYGFGESNTIIDRWMEEWQQIGKVSYS